MEAHPQARQPFWPLGGTSVTSVGGRKGALSFVLWLGVNSALASLAFDLVGAAALHLEGFQTDPAGGSEQRRP